MKNLIRKTIGLLTVVLTTSALLTSNTSNAQDLGADVVSSYVWRGTQFGSGAHIQPWVSLSTGDLEVGAWGSFPTTRLFEFSVINFSKKSKIIFKKAQTI